MHSESVLRSDTFLDHNDANVTRKRKRGMSNPFIPEQAKMKRTTMGKKRTQYFGSLILYA